MASLHVRYEGQSVDLRMEDIDLGDLATEQQVKNAAANALNVPMAKFAAYTVDRNAETGDITLRPQAVFG